MLILLILTSRGFVQTVLISPVPIRCTNSHYSGISLSFTLLFGLLSHSTRIHVIVFSRQRKDNNSSQEGPIIINSENGSGMLQVHCGSNQCLPLLGGGGDCCNTKLLLPVCSVLIYLALHFPFWSSRSLLICLIPLSAVCVWILLLFLFYFVFVLLRA